jgi:tetratricopeptide (TPR) repeat protein
LLPGTSTHRVLVTSRDRLADLDGARTLSIDTLTAADAVRMLTEIVASGDPDDRRVHRESQAAERIASLCGGLPLAIRVVAALLVADPDRSLAELAGQLADDRTRLGILHYDGSLAVRTAFDLSYRGLDEERARLFRLMGLHPTPDPSTEVVAALADREVAETRDLLRGLARAHLIHPAASPGCWGMHDLIRDYATELGARDMERIPALRRLTAHYAMSCEHLNRVESCPYFTNLREALVWADRERHTLVAVAGLAAEIGERSVLIRMVLDLSDYLSVRQAGPESAAVNTLALDAARVLGDLESEAEILDNMGHFYRRQGQSDEAMECLENSVRLARLVGARDKEARALSHLGEVFYDTGRLEESTTVIRQALAMARELDDPGLLGNALHNLGVANRLSGKPDEALALHLEDLRICHELTGDHIAHARILDNLGITYRALGDLPAAVDHHERAIEIARGIGSGGDVGRATRNLGCTYREWRRFPDAIACLERSAGLLDETHQLADLATSLLELGDTHRAAGDPVQAARRWEEALGILGRLPGVRPITQAAWIREALGTLSPVSPHDG